MDAMLTWQLPAVPGINSIAIGWEFQRPGIQPSLWPLEYPYGMGWSPFNPTAILPASDVFSHHKLSYRDPRTGALVPVELQPGDLLQAWVRCFIEHYGPGVQGSPSASSGAIWIPVDGQQSPNLAPPFTEPPQFGQTLPPPLNVMLTLLI